MKNPKFISKVERVSLTLFLICMFATAIMFIILVWTQPDQEALFMTMATIFVVGLASFLTWLPLILYRLIKE